jgi:hypothetical protein
MDLNKEVDMMRRLMRVRKVERLFHLPAEPSAKHSLHSQSIIDYNASKEKAQWKYIKLHFR